MLLWRTLSIMLSYPPEDLRLCFLSLWSWPNIARSRCSCALPDSPCSSITKMFLVWSFVNSHRFVWLASLPGCNPYSNGHLFIHLSIHVAIQLLSTAHPVLNKIGIILILGVSRGGEDKLMRYLYYKIKKCRPQPGKQIRALLNHHQRSFPPQQMKAKETHW